MDGRERRDGAIQELALLAGSSATRRSAISKASVASQFARGIREIIEAKASTALTRGNSASLPASVHGSTSSRATADATLSGIPFSSASLFHRFRSRRKENLETSNSTERTGTGPAKPFICLPVRCSGYGYYFANNKY